MLEYIWPAKDQVSRHGSSKKEIVEKLYYYPFVLILVWSKQPLTWGPTPPLSQRCTHILEGGWITHQWDYVSWGWYHLYLACIMFTWVHTNALYLGLILLNIALPPFHTKWPCSWAGHCIVHTIPTISTVQCIDLYRLYKSMVLHNHFANKHTVHTCIHNK